VLPAASPVPTPAWIFLAEHLLKGASPTLHPAQTLLAAAFASTAAVAVGVLDARGMPPQPHRLPPGPLVHMASALQAIQAAGQPGGGLLAPSQAVAQHLVTTPVPAGADLPAALASLAWGAVGDAPVGLRPAAGGEVPVRAITALLTAPAAAMRAAQRSTFVRLATAGTPLPAGAAAVAAFSVEQARAWRIPIDNRLKETLWRMAAGGARGSNFQPWHCPCGEACPEGARPHTFWLCPIARAVRAQLDAATGTAVGRASLWLLIPPTDAPASVPPAVWRLVCLAALDAMELGRASLWSAHMEAGRPAVPGPAWAATVQAAGNRAAARLWATLEDFARDHAREVPESWGVTATSPFLRLLGGELVAAIP
jgi:hypothetical protein